MRSNPESPGDDGTPAEGNSTPGTALILSADPGLARLVQHTIAHVPAYARAAVGVMPLREGIESLDSHQTSLVIIDARSSTSDPLHTVKMVHNTGCSAPLVLIIGANDALLASRALRAGAAACLSAGEVDTLLRDALERVASGERFVSEKTMQDILHGFVEADGQDGSIPVELLSDREMMIFQMLGRGGTVRAISQELCVNVKTVSTHCNNIRRKLHVPHNRDIAGISAQWMAARRESASSGTKGISSGN